MTPRVGLQRLNALKNAPGDATTIAHFDAALTVSAMRYISDLHIGRVNPKHFKFGIDVAQKKLRSATVSATETPRGKQCARGVERSRAALLRIPAHRGCRCRTIWRLPIRITARHCLKCKRRWRPAMPMPGQRPWRIGCNWWATCPRARLRDLKPGIYEGALVDGVKHFQARHGLRADGRLGKDTLRQLNTPLSVRVQQLDDALERWRWLPVELSYPAGRGQYP